MAGGMGAGERGPTLAERSGLMARDRQPPGACHCWVIESTGARRPGLLLEWRRQGSRWQGLAVYLRVDDGGYLLIQSWFDADQLRAARLGK